MAKGFLTEDFLLQTRTARTLYHEHAERMPIYDYHCHLPANEIAHDQRFANLTQAWLCGDHYKWRAMRANGVAEKFITGDTSDFEKFEKWAATVPCTLRNPLYHWTHLELKRYFGVAGKLLDSHTAKDIYHRCSEMLKSPEYSVRNLLRKMNVKLVCTTDGPLDTLEHHRKIREDGFEVKVHAAFRPDRALAGPDLSRLSAFIDGLESVCNMHIDGFGRFIEALWQRHAYFHEQGCRLSDYGLETVYADDCTQGEVTAIFDKIHTGINITGEERAKFNSAMLAELARMDAESGWVMQLHLGAFRNVNSLMMKMLGPDTGFDSIGGFKIARPLARFLDCLNDQCKLPKMIIYNLNPRDNELVATMLGNFQDGSCPGKMQFGSAWWFLDQKDGIERQLEVLSNMGLLSRFVGMLTDSRSFLSFPRHEYFRRVLCNVIGGDVEAGLLPDDMQLLGKLVEDISYNNAKSYFSMAVD